MPPEVDFKPNGVKIEVMTPTNKLRDLNQTIAEAQKLQRDADSLLPQLVRMIIGRLHLINPRGFKSSSHELLMRLKHELDHYDGKEARWKK